MKPKRYPRQLSRGSSNAVIALSETEVGKLSSHDTRSDIGSEAEKMRFANEVNGLVVRFRRLELNNALSAAKWARRFSTPTCSGNWRS